MPVHPTCANFWGQSPPKRRNKDAGTATVNPCQHGTRQARADTCRRRRQARPQHLARRPDGRVLVRGGPVFPMLPITNVANPQLDIGAGNIYALAILNILPKTTPKSSKACPKRKRMISVFPKRERFPVGWSAHAAKNKRCSCSEKFTAAVFPF